MGHGVKMPTPSVPYRILFDPLPTFSGSGGTLSASATFEVLWTDREAFINQALGLTTGSSGWPVPEVPWDCPFQPNSGLLAASFTCEPHTVKDSISSTDNTVEGHFLYAHVQIGFERPRYDFQGGGTPQNQIDVSNPILFCEQSIEFTGRTIVREGYKLQYVGAPTGTVPVGPAFQIEIQSDIVLNFPFVPYIPWNYLEPYIGKSNNATLFGKPPETIAFLGASLRQETMSDGTNKTSCVLRMSYNSTGWNKQLATDGNIYDVVIKGTGQKLYPTANLAAIWS
jgi:hypothetical protein